MPIGVQLLINTIKMKTGKGLMLHFGKHTFMLINDHGAEAGLTDEEVTQVTMDVIQHIAENVKEVNPNDLALVSGKVGNA